VLLAPNIYLKSISLAYGERPLVSDIHLFIPSGQWVALIGASGTGKTTLLRAMAGLTSKKLRIKGTFSTDNQVAVSQQIAYMGQDDLLLPWLTVLENTLLSRKLTRAVPHQLNMQRAKSLLLQAGLAEAMTLYPHQLSGGMRQRTALVRTLMTDKPIVLMDEPFSALDALTRFKLQNLAVSLLKDKTVLFITHDPIEALRLADKIYLLKGLPANLCTIQVPDIPAPRSPTHPEVLKCQSLLLSELLPAEGQ